MKREMAEKVIRIALDDLYSENTKEPTEVELTIGFIEHLRQNQADKEQSDLFHSELVKKLGEQQHNSEQ